MPVKDLGIYIHIPFCVRKCAYCDFLSAEADEETKTVYTDALCREIKAFADGYAKEYEAVSIFFGGGTPSVLPGFLLERIIRTVRTYLCISESAECTIECNPETVDTVRLKQYREFGFNRLSFGLQSTNARELKILGRIHSYETFLKAYDLALKNGFRNINVDLMSGLPGQDPAGLQNSLRSVIRLKPAHISVYSLILEEGTPLWDMHKRGVDLRLPDEDTERRMYYETNEVLSAAGYRRYEISNFAKEGYACAHNIRYWTGGEYIGFGLGAASLLKNRRFSNTEDMKRYLEIPFEKELPVPERYAAAETRSRQTCMEEFMFLGLRMMRGIKKDDFRTEFGVRIESVYGSVLEKHIRLGLLEEADGAIRLTQRGIDVSNVVFSDFLLT